MSNRIWAHSRRLGESAGTKSFGTAALHHEKYQPWNAFQSQAIFWGSLLKSKSSVVNRRYRNFATFVRQTAEKESANLCYGNVTTTIRTVRLKQQDGCETEDQDSASA